MTFEQRGTIPVELEIRYRRVPPAVPTEACAGASAANEACAPDVDADGVPDHRDVCLPDPSARADARGEAGWPLAAALPLDAADPDPAADPFGCGDVVAGGEASGGGTGGNRRGKRVRRRGAPDLWCSTRSPSRADRSYLDVGARRLLDRLARALGRHTDGVYEIAAHTPTARAPRRTTSSSRGGRATAVRHYLMLRGIGPNRLQARGYGERFPLGDESNAAGRRANRRIELRRLD